MSNPAVLEKRLSLCLLSVILVTLCLLTGMNVLIDPFGVFGTSQLPQSSSSNERYLKIEHLLRNPESYDTIILGSSRSGMTNPEWVEAYLGRPTYNLSAFSAKPSDMTNLFNAAVGANQSIDTVVIGIDAMSFLIEPSSQDLSRRHHPVLGLQRTASYWLDYILAPSFLVSAEKVFSRNDPPVLFDYDKGVYELVHYDRQIRKDHKSYVADTFEGWKPVYANSEFNETEWLHLESLVKDLKDKGIWVIGFLQPVHHQWASRMGNILRETKARAIEIGFEDLSGLGSEDDLLWYEQRHYRSEIAHAVLENLFFLSMVEVLED